MRVVHSCTSNSFSGLEQYVLDLATWQYSRGHDVELFCRDGSTLEKKARERGLPVWTIGSRAKPSPRLWAELLSGWKKRLSASETVLHMHAGGEPWYHNVPLGVLRATPLLKKWSSRMIKTILHYHIWINHRKTDPVHRAMFLGVDEVWTSSESARAHLASLLPIKRDRIRVVPYGRDVNKLLSAPRGQWREEFRAKLQLADDDILGVCVSRIEPIKGIGELFDAFVKIAPRFPKAHLAVVGGPSPDNEEARKFSEDLNLRYSKLPAEVKARFHFLGFVNPCEPVLAASDFYVLPSYEECMSLAMLDAAILGLPILGTNSGGTPSVARPDETGMLVPPQDSKQLAGALEGFYRDVNVCRRLGEGARALGLKFDQESIFGQIWDWYGARLPITIER